MKRMGLAGLMLFVGLSWTVAENAGAPGLAGRSAAWKKSVALAAGEPSQTLAQTQQIPEGDRTAFARDVLGVIANKPNADRKRWIEEYAAVAAALVNGAGGAKRTTIAAVADEIVELGVTGEARELTVSREMTSLLQATIAQLSVPDRVAFAAAVHQAIDKQKSPDAEARARAFGATSVALATGAGDRKFVVVAEAFCEVPTNALGAVAHAMSEIFDQRRSKLSEQDYLQLAMRTLQAVADCVSGKSDAALRLASAAAAFVRGAGAPGAFEADLLAKIAPDVLTKAGITREGFAAALAAAKLALQAPHPASPLSIPLFSVQDLTPPGNLPSGLSVGGETGLPIARENRPPPPPPGYQNQGIGKKR